MKPETRDSLLRYANERIPTGGFLRAVLANDLFQSVAKADEQNSADLQEIVRFIYNRLPSACYGSREAVDGWVNGAYPEASAYLAAHPIAV